MCTMRARRKKGSPKCGLGRCYELAGILEGIHGSHCLSRFGLSDGSAAYAWGRCGYYTLNKQVKLRNKCARQPAGDGFKLFTKKAHPKKNHVKVESTMGIFRKAGGGDRLKYRSKLAKRKAWRRDVVDPIRTILRQPNGARGSRQEDSLEGPGNGPRGTGLAEAVKLLRSKRRRVTLEASGNGRGAANLLAKLRDRDCLGL